LDLCGVGVELRELSGTMQRVESRFQLRQPGGALLPQLPLPQLSVLQDTSTHEGEEA